MRTAWISSVVFSFIAVLGVGGFSFFLISNKSDNREAKVSQDVELADNEVFASAILPNPRSKSSVNQPVSTKSKQTVASDDDYEIFESDDISISDVVDSGVDAEEPLLSSSSSDDMPKVANEIPASPQKLNSQGRLSYRAARADDNVLSRRIVPEVVAASRGSDLRQAATESFDDIPAEMEPDINDIDYSADNSSDLDALVTLNKFNSKNNFQPSSPSTVSSPKKSLRNLLVQEDDSNESANELENIAQVKKQIENVSTVLLDEKITTPARDNAVAIKDDVIAIIVNRENSESISISDVKNIYVDKRMNWGDGEKIITYNLPLSSDGREVFSQSVLDMSAIQAATEASNRVITNSAFNRTHTKADRLVVSYVARNPRAIGYVPLRAAKKNSRVRIILTMQP